MENTHIVPVWAWPRPDRGAFGVIREYAEIVLEQTSRCAGHCVFCVFGKRSHHGTMALAMLRSLLDSLPDHKGIVGLSGSGDALVLDDLAERIRLVKERWPHASIRLATALNVKRNAAWFRELFDAGLNHVDVSCFGHTRQAYSTLHGTDAFDVVRANMEAVAPFTASHDAWLHLAVLADAAVHFGIPNADMNRNRFINHAVRLGFASADTLHMTELHSMQQRLSFPTLKERKPPFPCSAVWSSLGRILHVTWEGLVAPCPFLYDSHHSLGDLRRESLEGILTSIKYRDFYRKRLFRETGDMPLCERCVYPGHAPSQDELARMAAFEGQRLSGQRVYFWGTGEVYEQYKLFFAACKPVRLLVDAPGFPDVLDGIPTAIPGDILLPEGETLPLVIFAEPVDALDILNRIGAEYPRHANGDVVLAKAKLQDWYGVHGF
ncbi:MAG: hypothetical protein DELT_02659 [Desulfovibrio sp.]